MTGSSHSYHPDSHTHGLADDCPRCTEHAQHPFTSLDDTNLQMLLERVTNDEVARSTNEMIAMEHVHEVLESVSRLAFLDSRLVSHWIMKSRGVQMVAIVRS